MSTLGWIHTIFGTVALVAGTAVLLMRKGTRWHRTLGHIFLTSMIALNIISFFMYGLFGRFGPFHWMAVASLITLLAGMVPVLTRRPKGRWLELHGAFISGAYVGLIAATAAEVTSRIPGGWHSFSAPITAVTTLIIIGIGVTLIHLNLHQAAGRTPAPYQKKGTSS